MILDDGFEKDYGLYYLNKPDLNYCKIIDNAKPVDPTLYCKGREVYETVKELNDFQTIQLRDIISVENKAHYTGRWHRLYIPRIYSIVYNIRPISGNMDIYFSINDEIYKIDSWSTWFIAGLKYSSCYICCQSEDEIVGVEFTGVIASPESLKPYMAEAYDDNFKYMGGIAGKAWLLSESNPIKLNRIDKKDERDILPLRNIPKTIFDNIPLFPFAITLDFIKDKGYMPDYIQETSGSLGSIGLTLTKGEAIHLRPLIIDVHNCMCDGYYTLPYFDFYLDIKAIGAFTYFNFRIGEDIVAVSFPLSLRINCEVKIVTDAKSIQICPGMLSTFHFKRLSLST